MVRPTTLLLLAGAWFAGCNPPPGSQERPLTLAVAASVQFAMEDILAEYRNVHPGVTVKASYGSSGNLFAQIRNQAPFDIFLAADMHYPAEVNKAGLAYGDQVTTYALGGLALWVPNASPLDVEGLAIEALAEPSVKKIAIANPPLAPYGAAAVAAMKALSVYEEAEPKLVLGENISQTAQFVESGAADIGFLALSHAVSDQLKNKGRYWEVPGDTFPPLEQGMLIIKDSPNTAAAREFRDFLLGAAGGEVLRRHGFQIPGK